MKLKKLLTKKRSEERWLINNLLGMGEVAAMYAPKDHHKTGMALKIAMEVITGGEELGASQSGKVLYYALDNPNETEMLSRVIALMENSYPDHLDQIGSSLNISWVTLNIVQNYWQTKKVEEQYAVEGEYYKTWKTRWLDEEESWEDMGSNLQSEGYKLVIIDTFSKAIVGAGVNDDAVIRKVIDNLKEIIKGSDNEVSILFTHHTGKDARKGMMGSSILNNDLSTVLKIKTKKDGFDLIRERHKSPFKGKAIPFKGRSVVINHNEQNHDSIYVDIGSGLDELSAEIVSLFNEGLSKKKIKGNTLLLGLGNTTTDKSFAVVFNRRWKTLIDSGFINEEETGNKHTD